MHFAIHHQVGAGLAQQCRSFAHLVHLGMTGTTAGGKRQHCHARFLSQQLLGAVRTSLRNLHQLLRRGLNHQPAVSKNHAGLFRVMRLIQNHEKKTRYQCGSGRHSDGLNCRAHNVSRGTNGPGNRTICQVLRHQHVGKNQGVAYQDACLLLRHAFVAAQIMQ